jgi:hypothetical protein
MATQRDKGYSDSGTSGTMATVAETAKEGASKAGEMIKDAGSFVGRKADDAARSVGGGMESLGSTIRDKGPHSGMLGSATSAVAGTLESSGHYLHEQGLGGMAEDVTNTIRRHPIPALLLAVGLGFLCARALGR